MAPFDEMSLQGLAMLGGAGAPGSEDPPLAARMFDTDGDGRPDLFLVDADADGTVDGVVRAVDTDGDGANDVFVQYDGEGAIQAIGRVNEQTGALEVVSGQPEDVDELLASLGLSELEAPEEALFTSFDDPYIFEAFGSVGADVPDVPLDADEVEVSEVSEEEALDQEAGASVIDEGGDDEAKTEAAETPPTAEARVVEIEDRSGAEDGSDLWALVDTDADGLADEDARLSPTSTGTYYGDINLDGANEEVARDSDMDGRIDTVDTTGQGRSLDTVSAESVASPDSEHIVDRHPGEDDNAADAEAWQAADDSADDAAASAGSSTSSDSDSGSVDTGSSDDPGSSSSDGDDTV